ncbi:Glyoxalase/Bleomycin resistance protein/Dihydroxybiphenyl dioxygenase [Aspergillus insuetus]
MTQSAPDNRIRLLATAFVVYHHRDLSKARQFFLDFGLSIAEEREGEVFFKGYGSEPFIYHAVQAEDGKRSFQGAAYQVESRADLENAARLAGATPIAPFSAPGGGEIVTLLDPVGHKVHLVYGQEKTTTAEAPKMEKLTVNYEDEKPRKGRFQRFSLGPAPVHRWGHYGVTYPAGKYEDMYAWYTTTLALAPSDIVYRGSEPITCFFHIDRGLEYTDHHAFFFKPAKEGQELDVAHAAFEVHDFDIQQLGHQHLRDKGYKLCWGVGRHVLGSQVFDYWFDSSDFVVEHYADGDLVNSETTIAKVQAGPQALSVWGPPVPEVF